MPRSRKTKPVRRTKPLKLSQKIDLLFQRGEQLGLPVTYRALAAATGENANNLRKIHKGLNLNPGYRTVCALARYFQVSLAYFDCATQAECRDFLHGLQHAEQEQGLRLRVADLSVAGLKAARHILDYLHSLERERA